MGYSCVYVCSGRLRIKAVFGIVFNKAGCTTTLVACGWAGAVVELLKHFGKCSETKDRKNIKKVK